MHDTLDYFAREPVHRKYHQNDLTFAMIYHYHENFILPLSHDEVVHGKGSLRGRMPGDDWQGFANLRALLGYQWLFPGKKLLFMGGEFGQWREWTETESLDWHLLQTPVHKGILALIKDLNKLYQKHEELSESDTDPSGFSWIEVDNDAENVIAFRRISPSSGKEIICVGNFSPVVREDHRIGLSRKGSYKQILNTDSEKYCGGGFGVVKSVRAEKIPYQGYDFSAAITLPPLSTLWFEAPARRENA
jgi:1,4-alpha-glucan branching enzyme